MQQKSGFKNLLLEKKLDALTDTLEKKEAQLNEVLSASNLDPSALSVVTRKLEVLKLYSDNRITRRHFIMIFSEILTTLGVFLLCVGSVGL